MEGKPSTLIGKFLGNFRDRFTGKLIHQKIMSTMSTKTEYSVFDSNRQLENSGASHGPFYWKTHSDHSSKLLLIFGIYSN